MNISFEKDLNKPNWVSSKTASQPHFIDGFQMNKDIAFDQLVDAIGELARIKIYEKDETTAHFICTTLIFRFKDDLYLVYDGVKHFADVVSASRIGHSDLGANRKRVDAIRKELKKQGVLN